MWDFSTALFFFCVLGWWWWNKGCKKSFFWLEWILVFLMATDFFFLNAFLSFCNTTILSFNSVILTSMTTPVNTNSHTTLCVSESAPITLVSYFHQRALLLMFAYLKSLQPLLRRQGGKTADLLHISSDSTISGYMDFLFFLFFFGHLWMLSVFVPPLNILV